jgi:hypothetical protein
VPNRRPTDPDVLPDAVTTRLLERASELDAAQRMGMTIAELRAAAAEAGISAHAFDTALAELDATEQPPVVAPRAKPRRYGRLLAFTSGVIAVLVAISGIAVTRTPAPAGVGDPTVEQAFLLRCLSPGQAAVLVRPLLDLPTNTVVVSPNAPGVLTVRGTPAQLGRVRALLDGYDGPGGPACARGPASAR